MQSLAKAKIILDNPEKLGPANINLCSQFLASVHSKLDNALNSGQQIPSEIRAFVEISLERGRRVYSVVIPNSPPQVKAFLARNPPEQPFKAVEPVLEPLRPIRIEEPELNFDPLTERTRLSSKSRRIEIRQVFEARMAEGKTPEQIKKELRLNKTDCALVDRFIFSDATLKEAAANVGIAYLTAHTALRRMQDKAKGIDPLARMTAKFEAMSDAQLLEIIRTRNAETRSGVHRYNKHLHLVAGRRGLLDKIYTPRNKLLKNVEEQIKQLCRENPVVLKFFAKAFSDLERKFIWEAALAKDPITVKEFARANNISNPDLRDFLGDLLQKIKLVIGNGKTLRELRRLVARTDLSAVRSVELTHAESVVLERRVLHPLPHTLENIASQLRVSREWVSQIEKQILRKFTGMKANSGKIKDELKNILFEHRGIELSACRELLKHEFDGEKIPSNSTLSKWIEELRTKNSELKPTEAQLEIWCEVRAHFPSVQVLKSDPMVAKARAAYAGDNRLAKYGLSEIELAVWDVKGGWSYSVYQIQSMFRRNDAE